MTDVNGMRGMTVCDPVTGQPLALALDASVQGVVTAVQGVTAAIKASSALDALFVTDGAGNYYVRRESLNEGTGVVTVAFLNLDGSVPGSPPAAGSLKPISAGGLQLDVVNYDAGAASPGVAVGDVVSRVLVVNTASPTSAPTAVWYNLTQGTVITGTPTGLAEQTRNISIAGGTVNAVVDGADPASPPQGNLGTGVRGWLATIAALLRLGAGNIANSAPVSIATDLGNLEPAGAPVTAVGALGAGGRGLTGWLSQLWQGVTARHTYSINNSSNLAAAAQLSTGLISLGPSPSPYTYVEGWVYSNQAGTAQILATDGTNTVTLATMNVAAASPVAARLPAAAMSANTRFLVTLTNGATTANIAYVSIALKSN